MTDTTYCRGLLGWLFGHKFTPRYDTHHSQHGANRIFQNGMFSNYNGPPIPPDKHSATYRGDVCVRCGARTTKP